MDRRTFLRAGLGAAVMSHAPGWRALAMEDEDKPATKNSSAELPATIEGVEPADGEAIRTLILEFMKKYDVPGLSLALTKDGALKLTGSFGFADRDQREPVRTDSLFRIASVSKPITSVGILQLVEQKKLALDHKVFAADGLLHEYVAAAKETSDENRAWLAQITVQHLLEHAAGGWGNLLADPTFALFGLGLDQAALIRWTLENFSLTHEPGTTFAYSNFGYCLLGRVIEQVTGADYEPWVQEHVLKPCGISQMRIGADKQADRARGEVVYYGQNEDPYGVLMRVKRMDANGGWIASAVDLARFAVHVDRFDRPADLLAPETIDTMVTPSAAQPHYAKGWNVNAAHNWWHFGSFIGGASLLARTHDGYCWAVVVNTRSHEKSFGADLDALPWVIRERVSKFSTPDLFAADTTEKRGN